MGTVQGPPDDPSLWDRFKEFGLTSFSVEHKTSMVVLFFLITVAGVFAYRAVPKESFPEVEIPQIVINTMYPGVSPADVESLVTRPLEEELNTIFDLDNLTSTSVEGYSSILAEFETDVDQEDAMAQIREKVDLARPELPADAEEPTILEFSTEEVPIMQVNLSGEYGLVRLKEIGEELQDRLEQIPAILRADLSGGLEREVRVDVDLSRLQFYGITFTDIIDAIRNENVNVPGGSIDVGQLEYLVRVDGEFDDPSVIGELVVDTFEGRPVYVRDVAEVEFGFADRNSFARLGGDPVVTVSVVKRSGYNIIETAQEVRRVVAEMEPLFPPTTGVEITADQSEQIEMMVSSLENNIISGLILIVGVLLFFLGLRTSIFVALAIPTSMLLTFLVLGLLDATMNMIVLFSLILALGMLVDNAIVIVENIYRYMEEGWPRVAAAKKATGEVAVPVVAATLTTLAAFAPLLFWPGMVGEFMRYMPLTLIVTLSSSLFVALAIIPTFCAMFMRLEDEPRKPLNPNARWALIAGLFVGLVIVAAVNPLTALLLLGTGIGLWTLHTFVMNRMGDWFMNEGMPRILRRYERSLRWSLGHRVAVMGLSGAIFVGTAGLFAAFNNGIVLFPEDFPPQMIWVDIEAPVGTRAEFTNSIAERVEAEVRGFEGVRRDVEALVTTVGGGAGGGAGGEMMGTGGGPSGSNAARVTLSFVDYQDRRQDSRITLEQLQGSVGRDIAGADLAVEEQQQGPPTGPPVNIEIVGEDAERIQQLSDEVLEVLRDSPAAARLVGLESDLEAARPELAVRVDREKAALYGLSTSQVGSLVRSAIQGAEAATYRTGNDEYDIIVRLARPYRSDLGSVQDLTVMAEGGIQIPLSSVAEWEVDRGYATIRRQDMDRMATIRSDVRAGYNPNAVLAEVREVLTDFEASLPPGYTLRYTGEQEEQQEAQEFLSVAFGAALGLIAFILISQFNSVVKPFIILSSVIMSTAGVLVALLVFQMPFSIVLTGVGIISLAGIVVNNAIVMIDYIDILRNRDGMDRREALIQGGLTRFRPVVLTAITTALGLIPLAIGLNLDFFGLFGSLSPDLYWGGEQQAFWGNMATVVVVGILLATVLTLILVPVMYSLADDVGDFLLRTFAGGAEGDPASAGAGEGGGGRGAHRPRAGPDEGAPRLEHGEEGRRDEGREVDPGGPGRPENEEASV
ncbi:MAG: efflux RND transporter permease subunit [Gemmatimonadota bacterium]